MWWRKPAHLMMVRKQKETERRSEEMTGIGLRAQVGALATIRT
jgi:hypothetical protein